MKVGDLDGEIGLLEELGTKLLLRGTRSRPDGEYAYALLEFGGTRLFLTPKPVFEDKLNHWLMPGLTHGVFEVDDLDGACQQITRLGTEALIEPVEISADFGSRRIAFFRSPNALSSR